jgi:very-short-patch-repair endonuclease
MNPTKHMPKVAPTKIALSLNQALNAVGIETIIEYWDGHKHVDICIPKAKIYIEIDGVQHYTNPNQIIADFYRDQYSADAGYYTLHVPNEVVEKHAIKVARAVKKILNFDGVAEKVI